MLFGISTAGINTCVNKGTPGIVHTIDHVRPMVKKGQNIMNKSSKAKTTFYLNCLIFVLTKSGLILANPPFFKEVGKMNPTNPNQRLLKFA